MKKIVISIIAILLCCLIPNLIYATDGKIEPTKITVTYKYKEDTNTVTTTMTSNNELKNTKPSTSWQLSQDKKQYTYEFRENTIYTSSVVDIYGNTIPVPINITQIDQSPAKVTVAYEYREETNTVIATMTSNRELQNTKPSTSWKLSEDKRVYTFEFLENTIYTSSVIDRFGNKIEVPINITQIDESPAKVTVSYEYKEKTNTVIVTMTSNKELQNTKAPTSWKLSEDKRQYTYEFNTNTTYMSSVVDRFGNVIQVPINVTQILSFELTGIDVSKHNGKINWQKVKDSGIDFAIIRLGYGQDLVEQDDTMFKYNIDECKRLGIPYGVYIYSYALNVENALSEADHVLRLIKGYNPTFGIWYDLEDADGYKDKYGMPSKETFTEMAIAFCEKIKANGYKNVGIYASLDWFENQLSSPKLDKYDKWVAQWGEKCTYDREYIMWQYTDKGQVDGINGPVDMNKYYKK